MKLYLIYNYQHMHFHALKFTVVLSYQQRTIYIDMHLERVYMVTLCFRAILLTIYKRLK